MGLSSKKNWVRQICISDVLGMPIQLKAKKVRLIRLIHIASGDEANGPLSKAIQIVLVVVLIHTCSVRFTGINLAAAFDMHDEA